MLLPAIFQYDTGLSSRSPIRMKTPVYFFLFLLLPNAAVQADEQAVVIRLSPVYSEPGSASQSVARIPAGTRVSVFERQGGWKQVFSEEKAIIGWMRAYQLRESVNLPVNTVETQPDSRGFLSGLAAFSRKASGFFSSDQGSSNSSTATIGIRGLSEAEIKSAQADFVELEKMKSFASDPQRSQVFAQQGGLKPRKQAYIPGKSN